MTDKVGCLHCVNCDREIYCSPSGTWFHVPNATTACDGKDDTVKAAMPPDYDALLASHKQLLDAAGWALRLLEDHAREEAERSNSTFELCDYSAAKNLRIVISVAKQLEGK